MLPMTPMPPLPSGGLTPTVPFNPASVNQRPPDMFRVGRRNPYINRPYSPFVGGYGGYGAYGGGYMTAAGEPESTAPAYASPPADAGMLRVAGTPGEAQVFVDSYFVGSVADIEAGRPLMLVPGPHRLEVRAAGYESTTVDIRISPNETLTYRASLDRIPPPRPPAAVSSAPMYLIPNCYLGNVPPRQNRLPSGCDVKQVQVLGAK
jgi:PEGA domain-containing protein